MLATYYRALRGVVDPTVVDRMTPTQVAITLDYDIDPKGAVRRGPGLCEHGMVAPECPDCRRALVLVPDPPPDGAAVVAEGPVPPSVLRKVM